MEQEADKYRGALKAIYESKNGQIVFEFLKKGYVDAPALGQSPELTYYKLGQKEFVQGLIQDATTDITEITKEYGNG